MVIGSFHPASCPGIGGARQYLHAQFPISASRPSQICELLRKLVPRSDAVTYHETFPLPAGLAGIWGMQPLVFGCYLEPLQQ